MSGNCAASRLLNMSNRQTLEAIFARLMPVPESGCWIWEGHLASDGYGAFSYHGRVCKLHRFMYEKFVGPIPSDMTIDHSCRVRCCGNPSHLEVVTNKENILRGNGAAARAARQTHCIRGHKFEGENLRIRLDGARVCRACCRLNTNRRRALCRK